MSKVSQPRAAIAALCLLTTCDVVLNAQAAALTNHDLGPTPPCRFEFDYPSDWVATPIPDDETTRCRLRLRPHDFDERMTNDDVDVDTVEIGTSR
jgi:hypothetical protein